MDCDSIVEAIHAAERNKVPNLIFDVRNNYGGHGDVMARITRALMGRTPDCPHKGYLKVNAATFSSPTLNWIAGDTIFSDYKPVEGRKGLYQMPNEEDNDSPSVDSLGYNGRLYVLIDSHSASASAFLAGTIKRNYRGYIVGRETKSAYHCETAVKFANIQLANSQFTASIPMVRIVFDETTNDRLPARRGVIPDCNIPLSEEEFHYDGDYILDRTLQLINRCHTWQCAHDAIEQVVERGITAGAHLILGLPFETHNDMLTTAKRIAELPLSTVKFHQLQVIKGTKLAQLWEKGQVDLTQWSASQYAAFCKEIIELLPPHMVIERMVSTAPSQLLLHPKWGLKPQQFKEIFQNIL